MAERNRATVAVDMFRIVGDTELAECGKALCRKGLIQFNNVHFLDGKPGALQYLSRRWRRPNAHDTRLDPGNRPSDDPGHRLETIRLCGGLRCDQDRAGTVVDPRCIAGGYRAFGSNDRAQLRQSFNGRPGTRMFVRVDVQIIAAPLRHNDRYNLVGENLIADRGLGTQLTAQRQLILIVTRNTEIVCDIFRGLGHRVDTVLLLERLVDEAPAQRRVVRFDIAAKRRALFTHDERCARHRFHTAGYTELNAASGNAVSNVGNGVHSGAAQPVHRYRRNADGESSQQGGHTRHVAIVFTGLVGAAVAQVIDQFSIKSGVSFCQCPDRNGAKIVRSN